MKNIISLLSALLIMCSMPLSIFAAEKPITTAIALSDTVESVLGDSFVSGTGSVDVSLFSSHARLGLHDEFEDVGGANGGRWYWGMRHRDQPGNPFDYVYSQLSCSGYQSRTSVKPGTSQNWVTSGWSGVGQTAYIEAVASSFGGNQAAYDYI